MTCPSFQTTLSCTDESSKDETVLSADSVIKDHDNDNENDSDNASVNGNDKQQ